MHYPGTLDSKPWNNPNLESANYFWDIVKYTDFVKDIKNMLKEYRKKNFNIKNIIKSIFSIQNSERHKIITILGIKIKLSRFKKISQKKKKKLYKKFNKHLKKMHKISNYLKPENREECFDRKFINDYVQSNKNYIKGDVLEFSGGDIIYAKKYGDKNINLKMAAYQGHKDIYPHADYHIDLEDISTLPEQKFDCIVATQVIMYMYDLKKTMENLKYMLKDNGALILTVPGPISYHSKGTRHMFSFTEESMTRLCSEIFGKENLLNVVPYGNLEYVQYCLYWMVPPENERHLEHENRYTLLIGCLCQNNKKN